MKRILIILFFLNVFALQGFSQESTPEQLNAEGVRLASQGNYRTAEKYFDQALKKYNLESSKLIHNQGWSHEKRGETQKAMEAYKEAYKRNPNQIPSMERLGYLYFTQKKYDQAIILGERVLSLDSENTSVLDWLAEAYAQRFKLRKKDIEKRIELKKIKKIETALKKQKEKEKPKILTFQLDFTIRSGYNKENKDFEYIETKAYGLDVPSNIFLNFAPSESWELRGITGVPNNGTLLPSLIQWRERVEFVVKKGYYYLGLGIMGNHFNGTMPSIGEKKLNDYKVGFVFGKYTERSKIDIAFYPRLFPADTGIRGGKSLDVDMLEVDFTYYLAEKYDIHFGMSLNDYYFFDHDLEVSDYVGRYDIKFGISFLERTASPYSFSIYFTERLYLINLNNDDPYGFGNGQGWGGVDAHNWFKGDPLSGVETVSHILTLSSKERINSNFYLYQNFIFEIVNPGRERHEFGLQLGVGGGF